MAEPWGSYLPGVTPTGIYPSTKWFLERFIPGLRVQTFYYPDDFFGEDFDGPVSKTKYDRLVMGIMMGSVNWESEEYNRLTEIGTKQGLYLLRELRERSLINSGTPVTIMSIRKNLPDLLNPLMRYGDTYVQFPCEIEEFLTGIADPLGLRINSKEVDRYS